ncbi:glycosyltransferase [Paramaledivibacter caminithermalis]|uniref:Glycosyltransferase, catalytic subunit of cellulose synthase and poly-beta-1,6-N-acetylglucosamine synthase n=1 Tax=Paramaledivibacter caminithermalis (strain DSM 15212 / CIP 107654 / DViRD3) TaxID=1121301 RepID=A0A1M6MT23_PARC5|nr:glycosyltransferase [Paramaledivibacter caminithermalis]SHJ86562.1 Glycosyltransferase, catalytic subunit of cellulose synthase and poly-beta-1,6-N-acetylglucosamine synthase [Paramaledivibacter caminithermalis DSM 15212]
MLQNIYDYLLLGSLFSIWIVILINMVLVTSGFINYLKHHIDKRPRVLNEYPFVSILIPAHNEEKVIEKTVQSILDLDYDNNKYEIIVVNDNSSDNSAKILQRLKDKNPHRFLKIINTDNIIGGKGKSNALNIGFKQSIGDLIAIYDADNTPERQALKELVYAIENDPEAGAVIGKFRCRNKNKNLLTRFINLEGIYFQWVAQAGRWQLFKFCTIPGTNFLIRRSILEEIGGWDTKAITEDTEISFRIYMMGYHIRFCPYSATWEQEPETISVWLKQRKRWVKGNYYVMAKNFKYLFDKKAGPIRFDLLYFLSIYIFFFAGAVISDSIFILSFGGFIRTYIVGYSLLLWFMAYMLFILSVQISTSTEKGELNLSNFIIILLMYFTYCKLWIVVTIMGLISFIKDTLFNREIKWYKTERF